MSIELSDKVKITDKTKIDMDTSSKVTPDDSKNYYVKGVGGVKVNGKIDGIIRECTCDYTVQCDMDEPRPEWVGEDDDIYTQPEDMFIIGDTRTNSGDVYWIHRDGLERVTDGLKRVTDGGGIKKKRKSKRKKSKRKKSKRRKSKRRKSKRKIL